MSETGAQPHHGDVVLGGQAALPSGAVVLGGLDGVRRRLISPVAEQRSLALTEALQHGQRGLNLVIRALNDRSEAVRESAYALLQNRSEPKVIRAVEQFHARVHYSQLQHLLAMQQWKMADQETYAAMLKLYNLSPTAQLRPEQIADFPCTDLRIIDQLWLKYSNGRFGFSVQKAIWQKYDTLYWDKAEVWRVFADRVGWRMHHLLIENRWKRYAELTFNLNAPAGHLPFLGEQFGIFTIEAIVDRLGACQLPGQLGEAAPAVR